jgi:hypothetical protein
MHTGGEVAIRPSRKQLQFVIGLHDVDHTLLSLTAEHTEIWRRKDPLASDLNLALASPSKSLLG